jgi:hypothetical protein
MRKSISSSSCEGDTLAGRGRPFRKPILLWKDPAGRLHHQQSTQGGFPEANHEDWAVAEAYDLDCRDGMFLL